MIRRAAAVTLILALAACSKPTATGSEPAATPPADSAGPASPAAPATGVTLTSKGVGALRIGMTEAEARQAVAGNIAGDTGDMNESCKEIELNGAWPGVHLMVEEGKLTRISVGEGSSYRTDKGVGVGDTPAQVAAAYPGVKSEPHKYVEAPAAYMTVWDVPEKEGIVFEINEKGVVGTIHAGGPSIQYVEGCL